MVQPTIRKFILVFVVLLLILPLDRTLVYAENNAPSGPVFTPEKLKIPPFAFVYGNISNLDDTQDPYYAINKLRHFPYLVCAEPGELSEDSRLVTDTIKTNTRLFGYVNLGPNNPEDDRIDWQFANLNAIMSKIDHIAESGWYGVFIDQFGYDFQETRQRQNIIVDYAHQKGLSCFVNAWFPDHVMGSAIDSYSNPQGEPTHLQAGDFYLIESFLQSGSSYRGDPTYLDKFLKVKDYQDTLGIHTVVLSYKREHTSWEEASDDIVISYLLAQCLGFKGWWFGGWDGRADYGYLNPIYDIGEIQQSLQPIADTQYRAETTNYTLDYFADDIFHLIAYPKQMNDPVIAIRHAIPDDYIDPNLFADQEALSTEKRLNAYGFTDNHSKRLKQDGLFDNASRSALNKFLQANAFIYYSTEAKDLLSTSEAINALGQKGELSFWNKAKIFLDTQFSNWSESLDMLYKMIKQKMREV